MKLRHAAALALVGWYLMMPPSQSINSRDPDVFAAISKWDRLPGEFQTHIQCEAGLAYSYDLVRSKRFKRAGELWGRRHGTIFDAAQARKFSDLAECISSDDQRLKERSK